MNDLYMRLTFEQYKSVENQLKNFSNLEPLVKEPLKG